MQHVDTGLTRTLIELLNVRTSQMRLELAGARGHD